MTAEEFAVWAEARPEKHWELFDGEPVLQQSQNWGHARHILSLAMSFHEAIAVQKLDLFVGTQGLVVKAGPHTAFAKPVIVRDGDLMLGPPGLTVDISRVFQDN